MKIDKKGQAVFEFLIFLPFYMALYVITISISNSLNGSINQQKLTRGYFFARIKNNSMVPNIDQINLRGVTSIGLVSLGWRKETVGGDGNGVPIAACYKIQALTKGSVNDRCDDKPNGKTTQYIRIKTMFGLCGATYLKQPNGTFNQIITSKASGCENQ